MILLSQNKVNTVVLTLSESVVNTGGTIYFLFKFINETTNQEKLFTAPDISSNILRYNLFNIRLTGATSENLTGGTININPDGFLKYEIYQQPTQNNLFISGTTGIIIEEGIVKVIGTNLSPITMSYSAQSTTYLGYQPNS